MKIVMFYHTLVSDWNHGNAHFLRGIATELISRGHDVVVYEPANSWSYENLVAEHGQKPIRKFHAMYPQLQSVAPGATWKESFWVRTSGRCPRPLRQISGPCSRRRSVS